LQNADPDAIAVELITVKIKIEAARSLKYLFSSVLLIDSS
jgi:hypothetical protein